MMDSVSGFEPAERWGHNAVFCNNLIYLWGGRTHSSPMNHNDARKTELMSQIFTFDVTTCGWTQKKASGNTPLGIRSFAAVSYGSDRLLHFGGYCGHDYCWHNSLHTLYVVCDSPRWEESTPDLTDSGDHVVPMKKQDCGMVCYNAPDGSPLLCVFGGAGYKNDQEWVATNELHLMSLKDGNQ